MEYLKKFQNHKEYVDFKASEDFIRPNVSWCAGDNVIHYTKYKDAFVFKFTSSTNSSEDVLVTDCDLLTNGTLTKTILQDAGITASSKGILEVGDCVKTVAGSCFFDFNSLEKVILSSTVTSIGDSAFSGCTGLTSFTANGAVAIGSYAFQGCYALNEIHIDDAISIGNYAFNGCNSLKNFVVPVGITSISSYAFQNCTGLTSITIPSGVKSIGTSAFYGCIGLTSITIPSGVTRIDESAFSGCTSLSSISVDSNNTVFDSRDNCNAVIRTTSNELVFGCTNTVIPSSVTSIGSSAFRGCGITSITIPSNVRYINTYAFTDCRELTTVEIEGNISSIYQYVFNNCVNLNTLTMQTPATSVGSHTFDGCSKLQTISLAQNCQVSDYAFNNCSSLTSVGNQSVRVAGQYAFQNCSSLTSIELSGYNIASIPKNAFYNCSSLTSVTLPSNMSSIAQNAFYNCSSLTSIELSANITSIGDYAFDGCSSLTSITIPQKTTSLGTDTFANCSSLTSISVVSGNTKYDSRDNCNAIIIKASNALYLGCINTVIPNSVTAINSKAFYGSGITSVIISDSVKTISANAFQNCSDLTTVTIGSGVTGINTSAFANCVSLSTINFNATNCSDFTSYNTTPFYNLNISTVNIGNGVQKIPSFFLNRNTNITSITIPNSVTTINTYAFYGCTGVTSITISESVTSIGNLAFGGCTNATVLNFNAIECANFTSTISSRPFYNTGSLSTINIGSNVTRIPDYMIRNSEPGNKQITCEAVTPPLMNTNESVSGIPAANLISYIHVPSESVETYKTNSGWSRLSSKISAIA